MDKPAKHAQMPIGTRTVKTAFAAMLCLLLYLPFGRNPTFACIGAIFGTGNTLETSWIYGGNRLIGTIIGGFIGMGMLRIHLHFYPNGGITALMLPMVFVGVMLMILISNLFRWPGAIQPGGVMLCIVLFNHTAQSYISYSLDRMIDTAFGVLVAVVLNMLIPKELIMRCAYKIGKKLHIAESKNK